MQQIKILGICGSLRQGSYNRMALEIAKQNTPENAVIEIAKIDDLPFFNQDLESNPPESVLRFREQVKNADAILFAVNEHNYSISAVLKNAIEWASRPYASAVLNNKPIAMLGASNGMIGSARAQYHLRQMLVQTDSYVLNRPEIMIPFAQEKFNEQGVLNDEKTLGKIKDLVKALVDWSMKFPRSIS
jgi:chromate reductase